MYGNPIRCIELIRRLVLFEADWSKDLLLNEDECCVKQISMLYHCTILRRFLAFGNKSSLPYREKIVLVNISNRGRMKSQRFSGKFLSMKVRESTKNSYWNSYLQQFSISCTMSGLRVWKDGIVGIPLTSQESFLDLSVWDSNIHDKADKVSCLSDVRVCFGGINLEMK